MKNMKARHERVPNNIIWFLTFSDTLFWGAYYAVNPLISIYLANKLNQPVGQIVGIGLAVFLVSRAMTQLVAGSLADRWKSSNDEVYFLVLGSFLAGGPFFLFPHIDSAYFYYGLQILIGIGIAMNLIGWRKLFAENLDVGHAGLDYGVYDSFFSLGGAVIGLAVGFVANIGAQAFDIAMAIVGLMMIISSFWGAMVGLSKRK